MTELLDEGTADEELAVIAHLKGLLPPGHVANERKPGGPLPFILVHGLPGQEDTDCSDIDALVSVHTLVHKSEGRVTAIDICDQTHRAMLYVARFLPSVELANGRFAEFDYVKVNTRPHWEEYGDDQILRKVARYQLGLSYAKVSP